jgi:hypothetical protein
VSFAAITLCVASRRVFIVVVYFDMTQSGNFWIHSRKLSGERVVSFILNPTLPETQIEYYIRSLRNGASYKD